MLCHRDSGKVGRWGMVADRRVHSIVSGVGYVWVETGSDGVCVSIFL